MNYIITDIKPGKTKLFNSPKVQKGFNRLYNNRY